VTVKTAPLNHPNNATGYRIEAGGKAICYVTDTEHVIGQPDRAVLGLVAGADIMIYDATYTDEEYPNFVGWGHSTWQEGVRLADAAGVKLFVAFHHDPNHGDAVMDRIAADLEKARPGSVVAREGMILRP
jgi:phosphoribosyl 1,2-cyclic phosphodiesterase